MAQQSLPSQTGNNPAHEYISITPLIKRLADPKNLNAHIPAEDIALAWSRVFDDNLTGTQLSALLTLLYVTGRDRHPDVIARCAQAMRHAAVPVNEQELKDVLRRRTDRARGAYRGGLCDIVGTGGDGHSTFNVSTTASIVVSPLIAVAKHGNRAQTSLTGSADVLKAIKPLPPNLEAITADKLPLAYQKCNYTFLLAPNFHPGMKYAAQVRRELGLRTIFNLMGPLANPIENSIEARIIGVAYQQLGPVFAEALQLYNKTKAMVVCGAEDLDEISCAGPTNCWWIKEVPNPRYTKPDTADSDSSDDDSEPKYIGKLEAITLTPNDFGLPSHPLSDVGGGKLPHQNSQMLISILRNELPRDDPLLHFILINTAALLVVSGVCDADSTADLVGGDVITERGPGGGRWKEGVRLARWCIESGRSMQELERFIELSNNI